MIHVRDCDCGARRRQHLGDIASDPFGAAGDQGDLGRQIE